MHRPWNMRQAWAIIAGLLTAHTLTGIAYWLRMNTTAIEPSDVDLFDSDWPLTEDSDILRVRESGRA